MHVLSVSFYLSANLCIYAGLINSSSSSSFSLRHDTQALTCISMILARTYGTLVICIKSVRESVKRNKK